MGLNARSIGLRIQQARVAKGMTQGQLAKALGIDRGSVGRWETGRSVPRQVGVPKVAKVLGQSPDWLLEGSGDWIPSMQNSMRNVKVLRAKPKAKPTNPRIDKKTLEDITMAWDLAKPEARLIAALLITGDWAYKLKLMNREVCVDEEVLSVLGSVTA